MPDTEGGERAQRKNEAELAAGKLVEQRTAVCTTCEQAEMVKGLFRRCKLCGCATFSKVRNKDEKCPLGKWPMAPAQWRVSWNAHRPRPPPRRLQNPAASLTIGAGSAVRNVLHRQADGPQHQHPRCDHPSGHRYQQPGEQGHHATRNFRAAERGATEYHAQGD